MINNGKAPLKWTHDCATHLSIALLVMAWVPKELLNQIPAYPLFSSYLKGQFCIILMALKENIFSLLGSVAS